MDIQNNNIGLQKTPQPRLAKKIDTSGMDQSIAKTKANSEAVSAQIEKSNNKPTVPTASQAREDVVRQAAESVRARTFYPISDTRFTIYKDDTGQYITRFTNLESGSVTTIPEPQLLEFYSSFNGGSVPSAVSTEA